jgi:regulatory protein
MASGGTRRLDQAALWEYAVRALAGRAHSSGELRAKLRLKAETQADIDQVLARLKEYKYLDDRRYAESFASARLENQKFGPNRVLRDLRQRRVAPAVAERTVAKVYREVDEQTLIDEFVRRRYRTAAREGLFQSDKEMASAYRRLLGAGFSSAAIMGALKRFAKNPELLDGFEPPAEAAEEEES